MKITMETVAQRSLLDQSEVCAGQKMDVLEKNCPKDGTLDAHE